MDHLPIPPGLAERAPELVAAVVLVGVVLAFLWRMQVAQARSHEKTQSSQSAFWDRWMTRHEAAEEKQMAVISTNTESADRNTKATERVAESVEMLADRLSSNIPFPTLLHDESQMTHSIASPSLEPHIGVPGGRFDPDVTYTARGLFALGEAAAWTIQRYGIDQLHAAGVRGDGAHVVVIDTGIDPNHPDLRPNFEGGASFVPGESYADGQGHGSHCAGIVCADDNGQGVKGVAPDAKVTAHKGLSNRGSGLGTWLGGAIRAAADLPGHRILSMSFGSDGEDPQISAAIRYAVGKGHWVAAAAGNSGPGSVNWPGALPEVVCVAALDQNDRVAPFSSANDFVDVGFGGVQILSTIPGGRFAPYDGTSMATPGVAGVLALAVGELLKRSLPVPNQAVMTEVLYATCRDVGVPGRDNGSGYGLVQPAEFIAKLVERVQGGTPPVSPPPVQPPPGGETRTISIPDLKAKGVKRVVIEL